MTSFSTFKSIVCIVLCNPVLYTASFSAAPSHPSSRCRHISHPRHDALLLAHPDDRGNSSYESSTSLIKGIVSALTSVSNFFSLNDTSIASPEQTSSLNAELTPPTTAPELLERITADYAENNYLWTGKLDISAFRSDCQFTDPTISFKGIDKYVQNVGNLVPVVEFLLGKEQYSKSELLEISNNDQEGYIETRWNMIGELNALPWKPKVDVIGRTKFWYKSDDEKDVVQVYFYDEKWEIPAGLALLQFITPANTIANSFAD